MILNNQIMIKIRHLPEKENSFLKMINSEVLLPVDQSQSVTFCTSMLITLGEFVGTYLEMIEKKIFYY